MFNSKHCFIVVAVTIMAGCASYQPAVSPIEVDPSRPGPVAGVGIEGHDVINMTDQMIRDMLNSPVLGNRAVPPQVIIDGSNFSNRGSQRIDKDIIVDLLRVNLNIAAQGSMVFVGTMYRNAVQSEKALMEAGVVDGGTIAHSAKMAGGDFKLGGTIRTITGRSPTTGMVQQYNQITFEMFDLQRGTVVWAKPYKFTRASADDIVYR